MNGILNIYKPEGISSNYVVQKIKKKFNNYKVGHGGTLDPFASGVLPIFINKSTKLDNYMSLLKKEYIACIKLGIATNTGDYTGKVVKTMAVPIFNECKINDVLRNFTGEIKQVPPAFSAKKVNGKRAYSLARNGLNVLLQPIIVNIYTCELLFYDKTKIFIKIVCSSGTYIRTLCEDIANCLCTVGYTAYLERTKYGPLEKSNAISFDSLYDIGINDINKFLLPSDFLLYDSPIVILKENTLKKVLNGVAVSRDEIYTTYGLFREDNLIRVYDFNSKFIGIGYFYNNLLKIKSLIY